MGNTCIKTVPKPPPQRQITSVKFSAAKKPLGLQRRTTSSTSSSLGNMEGGSPMKSVVKRKSTN